MAGATAPLKKTLNTNLYAVGKIVGCFGVNGFVKLRPMTHTLHRLEQLKKVFVGLEAEDAREFEVNAVEVRPKGVSMRFTGIDTRTPAELLIGRLVFVDEPDVRDPEKGSYFTHDIIGCEVWADDGHYVGTVGEIYRLPAQDVWEVRNGSAVNMIPAVKEFICRVDTKKKRIDVHLIEGLIESLRT